MHLTYCKYQVSTINQDSLKNVLVTQETTTPIRTLVSTLQRSS